MNSYETIATSPNKIHLSPRQLHYFSLINQGKSKNEAARLSGYSEATQPTDIENSKNLKKAILASLELNGLTTDKLGKKIAQGVDAKKRVFTSYKGIINDEREVDDNETQHKYVRTALELRGDLQESGTQVNIGIIEVPKMQSEKSWNGDDEEKSSS